MIVYVITKVVGQKCVISKKKHYKCSLVLWYNPIIYL